MASFEKWGGGNELMDLKLTKVWWILPREIKSLKIAANLEKKSHKNPGLTIFLRNR